MGSQGSICVHSFENRCQLSGMNFSISRKTGSVGKSMSTSGQPRNRSRWCIVGRSGHEKHSYNYLCLRMENQKRLNQIHPNLKIQNTLCRDIWNQLQTLLQRELQQSTDMKSSSINKAERKLWSSSTAF